MEKKEFQKIAAKYLNGKASDEEKELVNRYFDALQENDRGWNSSEMGDEYLTRDELYQKTLKEIQLREGRGKVFRMRWLSAAAIVLFIFSGLYYTLRDNNHDLAARSERFRNDVLPGTTKATLLLADGSTITLDDKKNGSLANQGGVVIKKTAQGQLIYDLSKGGEASAGKSPLAYNVISTPNGGKYMLILEDGTKIWLNSASSLRFPVAFSGQTRNVELTGEAYFEVAKNKLKPFVVKSRGVDVRVLGTHFNINSYPNESTLRTTLLEGSVEVSRDKEKVLLKPGNQAGVSTDGISVVKNADTELAMAWKNGFFQFEDARLTTIMRQLSRWYNVEFNYDEGLPDEEFTGVVSQSVGIAKVLEMLEQSGGVAFRIEGRKITVIPTER